MYGRHSQIGLRFGRIFARRRNLKYKPCLCKAGNRASTKTHLKRSRCEKCRPKLGQPVTLLGELVYTAGGRRVA